MSTKENIGSTATGGGGGGNGGGASHPDEISRSSEQTRPTANRPDDITDSISSEKGQHLNGKTQDFEMSHEKSLDEESGGVGQVSDDPTERRKQSFAVWYRKLRPLVHFLIWALWTM